MATGPAAGFSVDQWLSGTAGKAPAAPATPPASLQGPAAGKSAADWLNDSSVKPMQAKTPRVIKGAEDVAGGFRDLGDMFLGSPASAVKAAVESAVDAYKHDPKAGVKAGEALANNPYFAPWLHPLASAQQGITGKPADSSTFANVLNDLFGHATTAAEKAGKKVGVDKDTTRILVDDLMSGLGLAGLKGGVDLAGRLGTKLGDAGKPVEVAKPPEPMPIPPEPTAIAPKEAPTPLAPALDPHVQASLHAQAQDILDGKISQAQAQKLMGRHPALVDALKQTIARRNDAKAGFAEMPPEPAPQEVVKTRLADALQIGKDTPPEGKPLEIPGMPLTLDNAITKVKEGRRFEMSPEERIAWNKAHQTGQIDLAKEEGYKVRPKGQGGSEQGMVHPDLLKKLGIAAGGALLFNYLDGNNTWTSYGTGAALALAGVWAAPHIKEGLKQDMRLRIDKYTNSLEAATNLANIRVHILANNMEKALPSEADRIAVTHAREAGARAATPEQAKVQDSAAEFFKKTGELAQQHGVLKELLDNYVTHLWDTPRNKGRFGGMLATTSQFAKARHIPTIAEGKAMGLVPRTEDISEIVRIYGESMNRAIQGKVFMDQLKGLQGPDGRPLVAQADKAPKGYVNVDLPQLRGSLVHPDIAPSLRMFESPRLGTPFQGLSETMQAIKRIKVMGSLFHAKTLAEVGLTSREFGKLHTLPRHLTNFALGRDSMLAQLNETGLGKDAEDLVGAGMNISQYRESPGVEDVGGSFYGGMKDLQSYLDAVSPTLAKGSKAFTEANHKLDTFTWARLQTGLKMLVGTESMHRLEKNGVPREKAAEIAANYVNTQFGGLNWRRIAEGARTKLGRDISMAMLHPKARTVSQILLFAPDWTVSTIRQITQAAKRSGGPLAQAKGLLKPTELADLHRLALIRSAVYMFTAGNAVNYMLSGHMIWDNKNPLRIDLGDGRTMQFAKHITEPLEWLHQPDRTAAGKLSYAVSEPIDQLTGKEYIGGPPMQESRVQHAAEGFLPFPASTNSPEAALAGMAGFPIYGHTEAEKRLIAIQRRMREHSAAAEERRMKKRQERE